METAHPFGIRSGCRLLNDSATGCQKWVKRGAYFATPYWRHGIELFRRNISDLSDDSEIIRLAQTGLGSTWRPPSMRYWVMQTITTHGYDVEMAMSGSRCGSWYDFRDAAR